MAVLQLLGKLPTETNGRASEKADVNRFLPLLLTEVRRSGRPESLSNNDSVGKWRPQWKMVFIWQCPSMFMCYSICFFLAGLTVLVCTPLIRRDNWGIASDVSAPHRSDADLLIIDEVAVIYLVTAAFAGAIFMFASFWMYHYVDLKYESPEGIEPGTDAEMLRGFEHLRF